MFDKRVWQRRTPPVPVRVDIAKALPNLPKRSTRADRLPLWLRTGGVRLEPIMNGEVIAVCRLNDGQWLVNVRIKPGMGAAGAAVMELLVQADAVESRGRLTL